MRKVDNIFYLTAKENNVRCQLISFRVKTWGYRSFCIMYYACAIFHACADIHHASRGRKVTKSLRFGQKLNENELRTRSPRN